MNDKKSSTKGTRHINKRYFYVTNKVRSGDVVIVHHPMEAMVGYFLTKPLNGTPFKSHRDTLIRLDKELIAYYKEKYKNAKAMYCKHIGV